MKTLAPPDRAYAHPTGRLPRVIPGPREDRSEGADRVNPSGEAGPEVARHPASRGNEKNTGRSPVPAVPVAPKPHPQAPTPTCEPASSLPQLSPPLALPGSPGKAHTDAARQRSAPRRHSSSQHWRAPETFRSRPPSAGSPNATPMTGQGRPPASTGQNVEAQPKPYRGPPAQGKSPSFGSDDPRHH
jgi:hypothetical protein